MGAELIQTPQELWRFGTTERAQRRTPIVLVGRILNGAAESRYGALRFPNAAGGYQVTAGLTLILTRLIYNADVANATWYSFSATADPGNNVVAAPAGEAAEDTTEINVRNALAFDTINRQAVVEIYMDIAAGRFPGVRGLTGSTNYGWIFFGHEE